MLEIIIDLLKNKKELFTEYKNTILFMLECLPEEMVDCSAQIVNLSVRIDAVDDEIKKQCHLLGEKGDEILLDIKNKSDRNSICHERKQIFDISQSIYGIIAGLESPMEQIKLKAKQNMNDAMKKIEELTDTGKGIKYLKAVDSRFENGTFLNIKK
ncbi:MAG: hypothetical protein RSC41_01475 [Oscillospiraceae bacterium]